MTNESSTYQELLTAYTQLLADNEQHREEIGSPAKPCGFNIFIVYLLASSLGFFVALFSNHTVMNPYIALAKLMLPQEISESFDLVKVEEKNVALEKLLHLYLDEFETPPNHRTDLKPNGFYPETLMGDFPI